MREHNEKHLLEYPGGVETRAFDPYCKACVGEVAAAAVLDEWGPGFRQVTVTPEQPRGMPNSEARKRLEERQTTLTCGDCGFSGPAVEIYRGGNCLCEDRRGCDARIGLAKACLEPVTQA